MSEHRSQGLEVIYLDYLPKFKIEKFHGNNTQDARRWLIDLKVEFRDHKLKVLAETNLWVEVLPRETDEEAAKWMDSTTHIKRNIDNFEEAKAGDASYLEQALKDKFSLVAQTESSKSAIKMLAEFSQMKMEPLPDFYKRATAFLRLVNVSDRGSNNSRSTLSSAEDMVLNMLIKAFVSGLEDQELRHNAISRGATSTGSLLKTYEIVTESRRALDEIQKQLAQQTAQQKAEAFDEIYRAP
ncbi:hypothetical protein GcC1_043029 [Golovinomyces cichoracearum]|uniref:Retrotransposon gag domain-containing protein n=1 Tax=Golovinomyces cichoracearum TaxID=62708 RepID=A0A420IZ24_9PEZI|nr:hypothetical protein GcC1_043029 [Golovinomyces cichoracearum]